MATSVAHGSNVDDAVLDAVAARAWPAREQEAIGPWVARWSGGHTRRANTVAVLGEAPQAQLPVLVSAAEDFYRARSAPPRFQVSETSRNTAVDAALADAGYQVEAGTAGVVLTAPLRLMRTMAPSDRDGRVQITDAPSDGWLARWWASNDREVAAEVRGGLVELLWEIPGRCGFAAHVVDGIVVATGLGVVDGPWIGLSCLATDAGRRGRGSARRVVGALATWGLAHAARQAYALVDGANEPALRLAAAAGLETAYRYHYLVRA